MKAVFASLYPYISNIAIAFCFVPFLLLWLKKLSREKAYLFLGIYWLANGLLNFPNWIGQSENHKLQNDITLLYNLLDAPMALLVFYFSAFGRKKTILLYLLIGFSLFESGLIIWKGYNFDSSTIIIGVGAFLALIYSVGGVIQYFQKMEPSAFDNAMGFAYIGFLFAYGLFIIIYTFSYLKVMKRNPQDEFFVYYLSMLMSTLVTSFGLYKYARPKWT